MSVSITTNNITTVLNGQGTYTVTIPGTNTLDNPTIISLDGIPTGSWFEYYAYQSVTNTIAPHGYQAVFENIPAGDYSAFAQDTLTPDTAGPIPCPVPFVKTVVAPVTPAATVSIMADYYPRQACAILNVEKVPSPLVFAGFALVGPPTPPFKTNSPRVHFIKVVPGKPPLVISSIATLIGYHWQFEFPILPSGPAKLRAHFPDGSGAVELDVDIV